jgi:hypothetical protein
MLTRALIPEPEAPECVRGGESEKRKRMPNTMS